MSRLGHAVLAAAAALVLGACASTSLQSAWYDTSYQGGAFKRILVVGVGSNVANRRVFVERADGHWDVSTRALSFTSPEAVFS